MPQIHTKLDPKTHKKLQKKAKDYGYSLQEFIERTLMKVAEDEQLYFAFRTPAQENMEFKFKFIDLFAGIGGIRQAFEGHGGKCVFSSEWDNWCRKTYLENFGEIPHGDINEIKPSEIPDHEILAAGFPCQPFSIAGYRRKIALARNTGSRTKHKEHSFSE